MATLVTLGCSMTEGQGCWGSKTRKIVNLSILARERIKYLDRFYQYGWPHLVAKELGFDTLINLGKIGSSTSGQCKFFMEQEFDDDDVYVIWMLTDPIRFSFYRDGSILDINPVGQSRIGDAYINFIKDTKVDGSAEQLFYIKSLREICKHRKYKLIITYWNPASKLTQLLDPSKENYLTPEPKQIFPTALEYTSPVCNHPNEKGYEYMASKIVSHIDKRYKEFRVGNRVKTVNMKTPPFKKYEFKGSII